MISLIKMDVSLRKKVFVLAGLLWISLVVESWILRLPCKKEADFKVAVNDYALENNIVGKYTVSHLGKCVEECMGNYQCKSMNYKDSGADNCELNRKIKETALKKSFTPRSGWIYITTNYSTPWIGSFCEAVTPCASGMHCIDTCDFPGYRCFGACKPNYKIRYEPLCQAVNLALNKPAKMSTQYDASSKASNANDGNLVSAHYLCAVSSEQTARYPWWRVDLQQSAFVQAIGMKNREDKRWAFRSNGIDVRVGDDATPGHCGSNPICAGNIDFLHVDEFKRVECTAEMYGRYVSLCKRHLGFFDICEVEVYGYFPFK